jgi:hypothetical protein
MPSSHLKSGNLHDLESERAIGNLAISRESATDPARR